MKSYKKYVYYQKVDKVKQIKHNIKRGFQIGFFIFVAGACIIGALI